MKMPRTVQGPDAPPPDPKAPAVNKPIEGKPAEPDPKKPAAGDAAKAKKPQPLPMSQLPPSLQRLPIVHLNATKGLVLKGNGSGGDNSNTQFALLALWAARRHDVPTEYALKHAYQRFVWSQNADGSWGYTFHRKDMNPNTMTCVGLLGLAVGHGALPDAPKGGNAKLESPAMQNGLRALGQHIGTPSKDPAAWPAMENLYFLWSVERVAMLCDLKTIGGKDWYGWGAQVLLANQSLEGWWTGGQYHGSTPHIDTCFALLFLKRSNLVPDLTENLRLYMAIRDPEAR
jgi:hypothetical protein